MTARRAGQLFDQEMPDAAPPDSTTVIRTDGLSGAPRLQPPSPRAGRHRRRRAWVRRGWTKWRVALAVVVIVLAPVGWSYAHALTLPGTDSLALRTTEWLKSHGMRREVLWVEKEWYTHHAPKVGAKLKAGAIPPPPPTSPTTAGVVAPAELMRPTDVKPFVANPVTGEGVWRPAGRLVNGLPAVYTTFLRPDAVHTGLVTGVAWMNHTLLKAALFAGASDPGGTGWTYHSPIPADMRPNLYATFNSGFKLSESQGGYYAEGRTVRPLVAGQASLVIFADGSATVGQWGRDAAMGSNVAAVRQNLRLIVDGGQPSPGLDTDNYTKWGYTLGNKVLVWRSGIGVDAHGNLIYAGGNGLSVKTLAQVLTAAGAVRAMELDINTSWVDFMTYEGGASGSPVVPSKLLPDMQPSADKYFHLSTRDFIGLLGR